MPMLLAVLAVLILAYIAVKMHAREKAQRDPEEDTRRPVLALVIFGVCVAIVWWMYSVTQGV